MNNLDFVQLGLSSQVLTCPQLNLILTHIRVHMVTHAHAFTHMLPHIQMVL